MIEMQASAKIHTLTIEDHEMNLKWDQFVTQNPDGMPTHMAYWQAILKKIYRYQCFFLYAQQDNEIVGVLPLFFVNSLITGRGLHSMPGALCSGDNRIALSLISEANRIADIIKADYLLLRDSRTKWGGAGLDAIHVHSGVRLSLNSDPKIIWNQLNKDVRRYLRHSQSLPDVRMDKSQGDLRDFYTAFLAFSHKAGTPLFKFDFLNEVANKNLESRQVFVSYVNNKPVGGYFNLMVGNTLYGFWGAALHDYRAYHINHQAYWASIEYACEKGLKTLDLGRSSDPSGQLQFKSQWGDTIYPIYQLFQIYRGKAPTALMASNVHDDGRNLSFFRRVWTRLPVPVVRVLGPYIRRHIPFG